MAYYRQPKYFRDFHCIGGECPTTCCAQWRIDWTKEEVDKLKACPNCSPELKEKINRCFVPRTTNTNQNDIYIYIVDLEGAENSCPLMTENRLCGIQKELGEEYLSYTCRVYPRSYFFTDDYILRHCSISCPAVVQLIKDDENAMSLVNVPYDNKTLAGDKDSGENLLEHPELKYRNQLFEFFYEILSNKKRSAETSILLGALAAQKLSDFIENGAYERIPEIIKALRPQLNVVSVPSFENLQKNYGISLGFLSELVDYFKNTDIMKFLKLDDDRLSAEKYDKGSEIFNAFLNEHPHYLRNIALNMYMEERMPFFSAKKSLFENYSYFAATIAVIKLLGIVCAYHFENNEKGVFKFIPLFVRGMSHTTKEQCERIINVLKLNGCEAPSFIALMLK